MDGPETHGNMRGNPKHAEPTTTNPMATSPLADDPAPHTNLHPDLEVDDMSVDDMKIGGLTELDLSVWDDYEASMNVDKGEERDGDEADGGPESGDGSSVTGMAMDHNGSVVAAGERKGPHTGLSQPGASKQKADSGVVSSGSIKTPGEADANEAELGKGAKAKTSTKGKTGRRSQHAPMPRMSEDQDASISGTLQTEVDTHLSSGKNGLKMKKITSLSPDAVTGLVDTPAPEGSVGETLVNNVEMQEQLAEGVKASSAKFNEDVRTEEPPTKRQKLNGNRETEIKEEVDEASSSTPVARRTRGSITTSSGRDSLTGETQETPTRTPSAVDPGSRTTRRKKDQGREEGDSNDEHGEPRDKMMGDVAPVEDDVPMDESEDAPDTVGDPSVLAIPETLPSLITKDREDTPAESVASELQSALPAVQPDTTPSASTSAPPPTNANHATLAASVAATTTSAPNATRRRVQGQRGLKEKSDPSLAAALTKSSHFRPFNPAKMAATIPPLIVKSPKDFIDAVSKSSKKAIPDSMELCDDPNPSVLTSISLDATLPRLFYRPPDAFVHVFGQGVSSRPASDHTIGPLPDDLVEATLQYDPTPWLPAELEALDRGLEAHGRNFTLLSRDYVPTRTTAECISAYYRRKHTLRYTKVKMYRRRVQRDEEDEARRMKFEKSKGLPSLISGLAAKQSVFGGGIFSANSSTSSLFAAVAAANGKEVKSGEVVEEEAKVKEYRRISDRSGVAPEPLLSSFGKEAVPLTEPFAACEVCENTDEGCCGGLCAALNRTVRVGVGV
ncbi:hypothetical protein BC829DRAFT_439819 [Chytridium lagenaria]|nr:hypothetical protein BC829DRAFT_439819 [Chytridium lagenaria]